MKIQHLHFLLMFLTPRRTILEIQDLLMMMFQDLKTYKD
jgi:hypothetical protein